MGTAHFYVHLTARIPLPTGSTVLIRGVFGPYDTPAKIHAIRAAGPLPFQILTMRIRTTPALPAQHHTSLDVTPDGAHYAYDLEHMLLAMHEGYFRELFNHAHAAHIRYLATRTQEARNDGPALLRT